MENPLKMFESPRKLLDQVIAEIDKIQNYRNKDEFGPDMLKNSQFGTPAVKTSELRKLLSDIRNAPPERRAEIVDSWLIDRDKLTPIVAGVREDFGVMKNEEGRLSMHGNNLGPMGTLEDRVVDYTERMKWARGILGDAFRKNELDLLYADALGGPLFEEKIMGFQLAIKDLPEIEAREKLERLLDTLRR